MTEGGGVVQTDGGTARGFTIESRGALALKEGRNGESWRLDRRNAPASSADAWIAGLDEDIRGAPR